MTTLRQQLRSNAVALTSLLIALTSLGYNTWRNEHTEHNRNIRAAAFEILTKLALRSRQSEWQSSNRLDVRHRHQRSGASDTGPGAAPSGGTAGYLEG
jgi:hypothetical protein